MKAGRTSILYVDDEVNNLVAFKANFRTMYEVFTAESAEEGFKILRSNKIQIVITDQRMPTMTGIEFLEDVVKEFPDTVRMLMTGYSDIEAVVDAINKGQVYRYITKPCDMQQLHLTVANAAEIHALREENKELMKSLLRANEQLEFMLRQRLLALDGNPDV